MAFFGPSVRRLLLGIVPTVALAAAIAACSSASGDGSGIGAGGGSGGPGGPGGPGSGGFAGGLFDGGAGTSGMGGGTGNNCANGTEWIYLVDSNDNFLQFRPDTVELSPLGLINCPSGTASPFSMSVARTGVAWVLHSDGNIFHVNINNVACAATNYAPNQSGLLNFGMGFVANSQGSSDETLYVAGGDGSSIGSTNATLASIDTTTMALGTLGQVSGWPELTGTGLGDLWGFSPNTTPPVIQKLDKVSGAALETHQLSTLNATGFEAWAFAAWGGAFYIFLKTQTDQSTNIWRYDPVTMNLDLAKGNIGYRIVGAGVSTCAPVESPK